MCIHALPISLSAACSWQNDSRKKKSRMRHSFSPGDTQHNQVTEGTCSQFMLNNSCFDWRFLLDKMLKCFLSSLYLIGLIWIEVKFCHKITRQLFFFFPKSFSAAFQNIFCSFSLFTTLWPESLRNDSGLLNKAWTLDTEFLSLYFLHYKVHYFFFKKHLIFELMWVLLNIETGLRDMQCFVKMLGGCHKENVSNV